MYKTIKNNKKNVKNIILYTKNIKNNKKQQILLLACTAILQKTQKY